MGRMSHAQLPSLSHHRTSTSLAHCDDSIGQLAKGGVATALCERVEYPNIKNVHCLSLPKKLWATMSILALSSLFAVLCLNSSPVTGCRHGSVPTAWHVSQACSSIMHHGMPPCEGQPHVWLLVGLGLTASSMHLSLRPTSLQPSVGCCLFGWQVQSAINFLSSSLKVFSPVMDGRNHCFIVSSNGWSRSAMTGMVLAKYACPLPCMDLVSLLHYCMHMIYSVLKIDLICLLLYAIFQYCVYMAIIITVHKLIAWVWYYFSYSVFVICT